MNAPTGRSSTLQRITIHTRDALTKPANISKLIVFTYPQVLVIGELPIGCKYHRMYWIQYRGDSMYSDYPNIPTEFKLVNYTLHTSKQETITYEIT